MCHQINFFLVPTYLFIFSLSHSYSKSRPTVLGQCLPSESCLFPVAPWTYVCSRSLRFIQAFRHKILGLSWDFKSLFFPPNIKLFMQIYWWISWKKSQENRPLAGKGQDTESKRSGQKNQRGDSKVESNDSPEIPHRGETSDIPSLPLGMDSAEH